MRVLLVASVLLVLLPSIHASSVPEPGITNPTASTPTTLYFHLDANQDFPVNTQRPAPGPQRPSPYGLSANSLTCVPNNGVTDGLTDQRYATSYGFSSPTYVQYNYSENGGPRISAERGLSFDAILDPAVAPTVDWYLTTFTGTTATTANADPVVPNLVAKVTVRTGEQITLGDEGYNSGQVIAQGQTAPTTLVAGKMAIGLDGKPNPQVTVDPQGTGQATIYGFHVPMVYTSTIIPKDAGFSVRIDLFMSAPTCDDADGKYVMTNSVRAYLDDTHLPGWRVSVLDPLRIDYLHPLFLGDDVVFHGQANSPWGNYDVDETDLRLNITGPDGAPVAGVLMQPPVKRYHEHGQHSQPLDIAWVWPYKPAGAHAGTYTVRFQVFNDQRTATATAVTTFEVGNQLWATDCGIRAPQNATYEARCERQLQDGEGNILDPSMHAAAPTAPLLVAVLLLVARRRLRW